MPRGGSRKHPADCQCGNCPKLGRKKLTPEAHGPVKKNDASEIIAALGQRNPHGDVCLCWKCLWRKDAERQDSLGHHARKYLWDRRDGKPVDTVNHLHDKPIDVNLNVSISETIRKVRERKLEYERSHSR